MLFATEFEKNALQLLYSYFFAHSYWYLLPVLLRSTRLVRYVCIPYAFICLGDNQSLSHTVRCFRLQWTRTISCTYRATVFPGIAPLLLDLTVTPVEIESYLRLSATGVPRRGRVAGPSRGGLSGISPCRIMVIDFPCLVPNWFLVGVCLPTRHVAVCWFDLEIGPCLRIRHGEI